MGSPIVTGLASTAGLSGALFAGGTGLTAGTLVTSIDSPTQVTLNRPATAGGAAAITFQIEPISLAEAKSHLRITLAMPEDEADIGRAVVAARQQVEVHVRQAFLTQSATLYLDSFPSAGGYYNRAIREVWPSLGGLPSGLGFYPGMIPNSTGVINIPCPPLQAITSVRYKDFSALIQTVDPTRYNTSLGFRARIQPAYSKVWPISQPVIDSVIISFISGYGDTSDAVPSAVKSAILLLAAELYEHREANSEVALVALPDTLLRLLATVDQGSYY
jgi:hypothetical protein